MTAAAPALFDRDEGSTPLGYALPPNGPVPALTKRIVELLRIDSGDLVIDLCCRDAPTSMAIPDDVRRRSQAVAVRSIPPAADVARLDDNSQRNGLEPNGVNSAAACARSG